MNIHPHKSVEETRSRALRALLGNSKAEESEEEGPQTRSKRKSIEDEEPSTSSRTRRCFLCDYSTNPEVKFVSGFIADNVANMDMRAMAEQITEYICKNVPEVDSSTQHQQGVDVDAVCKHIRMHMLSPTVRIADMMRHLLKLCDNLRNNLERIDPETGESVLDKGSVDTYLKVVTKVMDMYKMSETSKMLFAHEKT